MDDASYLAGAANVVSTNTKMGASNVEVAKSFKVSADAQIAAAVKSQEAMRLNAVNLSHAAAQLPVGSKEQVAASALAASANAKYARSVRTVSEESGKAGKASSAFGRDLNKAVRGGIAGSGAFTGLGRSLAFASSGFLAVAGGVELIARSITGAEDLEKAQASLAVAIKHTGGNLAQLQPRYEATAKAAEQFGVDQATATTGLARATVLTGDAGKAQRAYQEALVISKATGKDFNAVLTATAKGQIGVTTSLRRYGILIDKGERGTAQFVQVMQRFGGQAAANTTSLERLHAAFSNTLATIGVQLLPTVNRLASSFANWLTKMNESGKLQRDVAHGMTLIHDVTGPLITDMGLLAKGLGLANKGLSSLSSGLKGLGGIKLPSFLGGGSAVPGGSKGGLFDFTDKLGGEAARVLFTGPAGIAYAFKKAIGTTTPGVGVPSSGIPRPGFLPSLPSAAQPAATPSGLFGGAKPMTQYFKQFQLGFAEQLAQVQASLTRSTADDVTAAKQVVARIKGLIDQGRLRGPALVQALQLESSALTTIWSAEDAAAQKRAAAAQAAKQKILTQIQNAIDPLRLEVALSRAEAFGKPTVPRLKDLLAAAIKGYHEALKANNLALEKQALDQITSLKQQIKDATKKAAKDPLGGFKQLNLNKLTSNLDLTPAQRKALKARLSQVGPHGTVPNEGVGAYGYRIGANDRPIHVHTTIDIDGRKVARNTTTHQQRHRNRNSSQRRGPNAGSGG